MLDEREIDGRTADGTHHRDGLRSDLLGHDDAETRGNLRQETDEKRRALADSALVQREVGDLDQPAGEHRADREIVGLQPGLISRRTAEREHFEACEPRPRVCQILAFLLRDRRDGAQHDRGRDR